MTELKTDVGRFCAAMCDLDAAACSPGTRAYTEAVSRRQIVEHFDATGALLDLGSIAAEHAYHPDYQNWPAYPWAQHQNWPPLDPNGVLA